MPRLALDPLAVGALSGAAAALVFLAPATPMVGFDGLFGSRIDGGFLAGHLLIGAIAGAAFARVIPQRGGGEQASRITLALMFGLILWIVGPLTIGPALDGEAPTWSVEAASVHFPSLIAHLMYGGGLGLLLAVAARMGAGRESEAQAAGRLAAQPIRVVILGVGFGGMRTAQRFEEAHWRVEGLDVTLVSRSNFLLFTPMLAEVASSGLDAQAISAPIRVACPHTRFRHADVQAIDTAAKTVTARPVGSAEPEHIPYDHLVLAVGSVPAFYGLPGLAEHAFSLKTLEDAAQLRNHVISALESAVHQSDIAARQALLTFVVAGGGFAGTEAIAELFDLVRSVRRYYPGIGREEPRFVLVHSSDRIIPELSRELGDYAREKLQRRGIQFMLGKRVAGADARSVTLNDDSQIPTRTLVWTAGNQPSPLLRDLPCEHNRRGQVIVEPTLQVPGLMNVWALGDGAQVPDVREAGAFHPPTAQHAIRQGKTAADNVVAVARGHPPKPFTYRSVGSLVALGSRTAAAEVAGQKFSGLVAWLMWRTIYFSKLPGMDRKVRVALDWAIDLLFPRDIVLLPGAQEVTVPQADRRDGAVSETPRPAPVVPQGPEA